MVHDYKVFTGQKGGGEGVGGGGGGGRQTETDRLTEMGTERVRFS